MLVKVHFKFIDIKLAYFFCHLLAHFLSSFVRRRKKLMFSSFFFLVGAVVEKSLTTVGRITPNARFTSNIFSVFPNTPKNKNQQKYTELKSEKTIRKKLKLVLPENFSKLFKLHTLNRNNKRMKTREKLKPKENHSQRFPQPLDGTEKKMLILSIYEHTIRFVLAAVFVFLLLLPPASHIYLYIKRKVCFSLVAMAKVGK